MKLTALCIAFRALTITGANFTGDRIRDQLQRKVFTKIVHAMPIGAFLELPVNSSLGPNVKVFRDADDNPKWN